MTLRLGLTDVTEGPAPRHSPSQADPGMPLTTAGLLQCQPEVSRCHLHHLCGQLLGSVCALLAPVFNSTPFPSPDRSRNAAALRATLRPSLARTVAKAVTETEAVGAPTSSIDWDNLGFGIQGVAPVRRLEGAPSVEGAHCALPLWMLWLF